MAKYRIKEKTFVNKLVNAEPELKTTWTVEKREWCILFSWVPISTAMYSFKDAEKFLDLLKQEKEVIVSTDKF